MAFGKRIASVDGQAAVSAKPGFGVPLASPDAIERAKQLQAHVEKILREATVVVEAIKTADRLDARGFGTASEPDSYPIGIAGFSRHFNFVRDGKVRHGVFAFTAAGGALDHTAQLGFFELATTVMRLDAFCLSAFNEDALSVAIQSAPVRADIDRIIVLSCFLIGLLETLALPGPETSTVRRRAVDDQVAKRQLEWQDRAKAAMLDAQAFEKLLPKSEVPLFLVETEVDDHEGQLVVNNVYLPSEIATPMRQVLARDQLSMMGGDPDRSQRF